MSTVNYLFSGYLDSLPAAATTPTTLFYLVLITFLLFKYKRQNDKACANTAKKQIPGPARLPIVGNMLMLRSYADNPWAGLNKINQQYGEIVSLKVGMHSMILISNFEYMKEVLVDKGEEFADRPNFSTRLDIIGGGNRQHLLALCDWSEVHRVRRKYCQRAVIPSKSMPRNQLLESIISEYSNDLVNRLEIRYKQNSGKDVRLIKQDILFLAGDIFLKYLCNHKYSHTDADYRQFTWYCDFLNHDITLCHAIDYLPFVTKLGIQRNYLRKLSNITDLCRNFIYEKIYDPRVEKHSRELEANKSKPLNDESHDILDRTVLEQLTNATIMQVNDYKVGFSDLLAAHAAVANILTRMLGLLALNREAQDLLYEEAKKTKLSSLDHRPHTPVAEAALLETLRWASSPTVPHVARQDTSIGEYFVPKGSNVLFNCYHLNLSEKYWHEPRKFNIKRFLVKQSDPTTGESGYELNVPAYFRPFSFGVRQCIGFRMVESISMVAAELICEKFILKVDDRQLAEKLLVPKGTMALNPSERCYEIELEPRAIA